MLGRKAFIYLIFPCVLIVSLSFAQTQKTKPIYIHTDAQGKAINLVAWQPDFWEKCYFPEHQEVMNEQIQQLQMLLESLKQESSLGLPLLETALKTKVAFCLDTRKDVSYSYYDKSYNIIVIKAFLDADTQLLFLVHELRHIDQIDRGFCPSLAYSLKSMAQLSLADEADAQAVTTLFAWRLSKLGEIGPWQSLLAFETYGDIAEAFATEMSKSHDELRATQCAFQQWYENRWRPDAYYFAACIGYMDDLDEQYRLESNEPLPENYYQNLSLLPGGSNYDCVATQKIESIP
ncbi:MAG: hypothetical protein KC422_16825 [Trueperaceae bacterium]|nr:hypothetical protein [Trueperaceae bacterium]